MRHLIEFGGPSLPEGTRTLFYDTTLELDAAPARRSSTRRHTPTPATASRSPTAGEASWKECLDIARDLLTGAAPPPEFPGADSYHDISIAAPPWAAKARFCGQSGRMRMYDVDRDYEAQHS